MEMWQAKVRGISLRDGEVVQWDNTFEGLMKKLANPRRDKYSTEIRTRDLTMEILYAELSQ